MTLAPLDDVGRHWFFAECFQFVSANNTDRTELQQAEDMAYFRAEIRLLSPESNSAW